MRYFSPVVLLVVALVAAGCSRGSGRAVKQPSPADIVAKAGGTSITLADVDQRALQLPVANFNGLKLSQALYEARRSAVDDLIDEALIAEDAKGRKLDRAKLIEQEITSKVSSPTDAEVSSWFDQNQARLQGATLEQTRTAIVAFLTQQRTQTARQLYVDTLRRKAPVQILLEPPRQTVAKADRPSKGPANAPIEMIEFSDFQCPFCLRAFPTVAQVIEIYGDRVRLVYRHYPLTNHPDARPAAEAAQCAAEQGKFWQYHDALFGDQAHLSDADLKQHATALGMDGAKFNACVDSRKYKADIDTDIQAGNEAGVSGTPAFFINGRILSGALPFDEFKRIIDEELAAAR
jgi:protein-disulfide isomerase